MDFLFGGISILKLIDYLIKFREIREGRAKEKFLLIDQIYSQLKLINNEYFESLETLSIKLKKKENIKEILKNVIMDRTENKSEREELILKSKEFIEDKKFELYKNFFMLINSYFYEADIYKFDTRMHTYYASIINEIDEFLKTKRNNPFDNTQTADEFQDLLIQKIELIKSELDEKFKLITIEHSELERNKF